MKHQKQFALMLSMLMLTLIVGTQTMHARGTAAGTHITTAAAATYTTQSGAANLTATSNSVTVTVAQLASANVSPVSGSQTTVGDGVYVYYPFTVANWGNGSDSFNLSAVTNSGYTVIFFHDTNGNGVADAGETITTTPSLAADATYDVVMRVTIPKDPTLNGHTDVATATVSSNFTPAKTATYTGTTLIQTAKFDLSNSLSVLPASPNAGDNVVYTFAITNSGAIAATNVTFTDPILANLTYVSGTGTGFTAPTGAGPATWSIPSIPAGGQVIVTLTLKVSATAAQGTLLTNQITVDYSAGGVAHTAVSNSPGAAVGATPGVTIALSSFTKSVDMEDVVTLPLTVTNTGNIASVFEMSSYSQNGYTWTFYTDNAPVGTFGAEDVPLTNTNGYLGVDIGSLNPGSSYQLIARMAVPIGVATDQMHDQSTLTATSAAYSNVKQSSVCDVTINIPIIDLHRSVDGPGNTAVSSVPGDVNTYTTTYRNIGHGKAYQVKIIENEPANSTYVANSVVVDGVAQTDNNGVVTVTGAVGSRVITITLGTVNGQLPAVPGSVSYRATVN